MKYKVTVGVNWFECPTSLECEGVIKTIYISGNNEKKKQENNKSEAVKKGWETRKLKKYLELKEI